MDSEQFAKSLNVENDELLPFIPYLLQDLRELGSRPELQIKLLKNTQRTKFNAIDLGCGKGACLIELLKHFKGQGLGVDLQPEFIHSAREQAISEKLQDRLEFKVEDLCATLEKESGFDLVIYGMDSNILGAPQDCFTKLGSILCPDGLLLVEASCYIENMVEEVPGCDQLERALQSAGFTLIERVEWQLKDLKMLNALIYSKIQYRVEELCKKYSEKKPLFLSYLKSQRDENELLENHLRTSTYLAQRA